MNLPGVFEEAKVDVLVIGNLVNIRYLTGFTGSNALLALFPDRFVFWTDPRYRLQALREVGPGANISAKPLLAAAETFLRREGVRRVGFERQHLRFEQYELLRKKLRLVPVSGVVEQLRQVKTEAEIQKIRAAVMTNSAAFERALATVRPGMRERDFAALLDYKMRRFGAEAPAFETIVAAGEHGALPHAKPGDARFAPSQLVLVDMGAARDGYTSDMTRMFHLGEPPRKVRKLYKAVLEAQMAALDAIKPGVPAGRVDQAARDVLQRHGLDKQFIHSTGHGLGLEIHEEPRIGKTGKTRLQAGMVITVEPGVYLEGWGGIRIEDTVVVTARGCEVLTPTSKELRIVESTVP